MYSTAINGTMYVVTAAILLIPPIITSPTNNATTIAVITVDQLYDCSPRENAMFVLFGSKKVSAAFEMPLICAKVPVPMSAANAPKIANRLPSHLQFFPANLSPIPFSI